ncbi:MULTISPECIES: recombination mediator RecR [unclassified Schaalia]|jgi:recombination protein RecR|uniref:recombination mediator RecR n=1 Tax=unclassified Schaalia TaxID=2691889 RepID=UPI0015F38912|nr:MULTISPECIES: recombination mediator RecR [unclassified Schaalia]
MSGFEGAIQDLIDQLGALPGIGPKSAQRLAFHLLGAEGSEVQELVSAIEAVKQNVHFCSICGNVTEAEVCSICSDTRRDSTVLCVVEEAKDINAIEKTRAFRGMYHVLGGVIDPLAGVGADSLRIRELFARLGDGTVQEVILATNPTVEGEATSSYIARSVIPMGVSVTRLASGLPVGGDLEYADEVTLGRALEGRLRI